MEALAEFFDLEPVEVFGQQVTERISEVTDVFERERTFAAVSHAIATDAGVADVSGYTDYGRVWLEFLDNVVDDLDPGFAVETLAERTLAPCLAALVPAVVEGLVREAIISDGGSTDDTHVIAEAAGARFVAGERGRGAQLARGASLAKGDWLLFLHADTVLEEGWEIEADQKEAMEKTLTQGVYRTGFDALPATAFAVATSAPVNNRNLHLRRSLAWWLRSIHYVSSISPVMKSTEAVSFRA